MNAIVQAHPQFGVVPQYAVNPKMDPKALGAGITGSFGVLSFKGKSWAIRYHGQNYPLWQYDAQGRPIGSVPALEIVMIAVSPTLAKTYYEKGYVDGQSEAPDCFSTNAVTPDPSSPKLQSTSCKTCRWDRFGSKITDNGSQSKACQDHKRVAFVPGPDLRNERFGGPMLLRVPPASLTGLLDFSDRMAATGWPYYALVAQISFQPDKPFPLIVFREIRPLSEQETAIVRELQDDPRTARIINEGVEFEPTEEQLVEAMRQQAGQAQPQQQAAPQAQPTPQPQPQAAPPAATAPPVTAAPGGWGVATAPPAQPVQPAPQQGAPQGQPIGSGGFDPGPMPPHLVRTPEPVVAVQPTNDPAPATAPTAGLPPGVTEAQAAAFLQWQRDQAAAAGAPTPAAAAPAKRTRKPRTPAVNPGPTNGAATAPQAAQDPSQPPLPLNGEVLPPQQPGQPVAPAGAPATGGWGAPSAPTGAPLTQMGNGMAAVAPQQPAAPGAPPTNDPALAALDERLKNML